MRRLICAFVGRIWYKQVFSWRGSLHVVLWSLAADLVYVKYCLMYSSCVCALYNFVIASFQREREREGERERSVFVVSVWVSTKYIRIFNGCAVRIANSVTKVTVRHHCLVMPNSKPRDAEQLPSWQNFKSAPHNHYGFFFLHTLPSKIALRKRLRMRSVISVNYHLITVLCPFILLIRFKCYM